MSTSWATASESWQLGDWSLERRDDEIADIRFRGALVLRSVRAVVRDHDWNTPILVVDEVHDEGDALAIAVHTEGFGARIAGAVRVTAEGDRLTVSWRATAEADYRTNRAGLVVLHPPLLAGSALTVAHADGRREESAFPREISPHQPVLDIAGLAWHVDGLGIEAVFRGDVFEMEDQRNWTDASFKTYSRPLALPFPYPIAAGEELRQVVEITVRGEPGPAPAPAPARIRLQPCGAFPSILTSASTAPDPAPAVPPLGEALLVELDLASPNWPAALDRAAGGGVPLDVRLVLPEDGAEGVPLSEASVAALVRAAEALSPLPVTRIAAFTRLVHSVRSETIEPLRAALRSVGIDAEVLGGVRSHFTELNREQHLLPGDVDGVTFAVTPLFHALGTEQLVESVAMQRLVAGQAVGIAAGRPVHIGPVTLRPRFNDVATEPQPGPSSGDLSEGYGAEFTGEADGRQDAPELATWTVASAAALAVPGVASLCFFEQWGPRGIRDAAGRPRPVADALETLAELRGGELLSADSPDGLAWAIGSRTASGTTVLVANLAAEEREVTVGLETSRSVTLGPLTWERIAL